MCPKQCSKASFEKACNRWTQGPFDRPHMTSYQSSIVTVSILYCFQDIDTYLQKLCAVTWSWQTTHTHNSMQTLWGWKFQVGIYRVGFSTDMPSLRVTKNDPLTSIVFDHCRAENTLIKILLESVGFRSWSRFLAVSLQVMWVMNPAVGCHYFPSGLQLPSQPLRGLPPILHKGTMGVNSLPKTVTRQRRDCNLILVLLRLSPAR